MDGDLKLEEELGALLVERKETLSVAESCTGGMLGSLITSVSGSSVYFLGGVIAYANRIKIQELEIDPCSLEKYGAVSEEVAGTMAVNVARKFGSDYGVGITGIAGPGGETDGKKAGLVYVGVAGEKNCVVEEYRFGGDRKAVREETCTQALLMLRQMITGTDNGRNSD